MSEPSLLMQQVIAGYDDESVLTGLSLTLKPGSITGLLGRNGSGKSTLMRVATGLLKPKSGSVQLFGQPAWDAPATVRQRIGYVPQQFTGFGWMDTEQCLDFIGGCYAGWDRELVQDLRISWRVGSAKISKLSVGDQQKVAILLAIGHKPDLLILDEPIASLDPAARRDFLRTVVKLNLDVQQTILLSSHITSDIERICSDVAILKQGRICCHLGLDELKESLYRVPRRDGLCPPGDQLVAESRNDYWVLAEPDQGGEEPVVLEDFFLEVTE